MKRIKSYFFILSLISLSIFSSCGGGGDDTPQLTEEEQRLVDLAGTSSGVTWLATSVTFDGAPTNGLDNFAVTFRANSVSKTYTSVDGDPFLAATGTWDFVGTNINQITFDGGDNVYNLSLNTSVDPSVLTMTVNYTSNGGVRAGASGTYIFTLEEQ